MRSFILLSTFFLPFSFFSTIAVAQCNVNEVEVAFTIRTDSYGNELYWQLVPHNNVCGNGVIASGGNNSVGCNGGNAQNNPTGGYGDNATINAGPWCLTQGNSYDLIMVDDWDDGANQFTINIEGYDMYSYNTHGGTGGVEVFTFVAAPPLAYNMGALSISTPKYLLPGAHQVTGRLKNYSSNTITSLTINYSINNGAATSSNLSGLNIPPFTEYTFIHPVSWVASDTGEYELKIWASNLNGNADMDLSNDEETSTVVVLPLTPFLIDQYLSITPVFTDIVTSANGVNVPRDLDFHPDFRRYELWSVLKETENTGGKTVIIHNAGRQNQTSEIKQDQNAWHFMSLPTAIAFSDNENFATAPGVYDANHDGGMPFTGPSLWSSDPAIYAQPSGLNGSHYDMLHESPYSMGICHEKGNAFWVMDGNSSNVIRYDFQEPHVPGGSDHSDGIIWRYPDVTFQPDPNYHVPSHCVLDKKTSMLYMVDFGGRKVIRMDIRTGTPGSALIPHEATLEYRNYDDPVHTVVIDTGLVQPSGIEIFADRLLVSDYSTGDIRIYNIAGSTAIYLGKVSTGAAGVMGIKVGPDGKIWYVNATQNKIVRIDGPLEGAPQLSCDSFCVVSITHNAGYLDVTIRNNDDNFINYPIVQVFAANGDTIANQQRTFDYYGQLPGTIQTYHIATVLDSFPTNFNGQIRLEDGLYNIACTIPWCNNSTPTSILDMHEPSLMLYPNPSSHKIYISSTASLLNAEVALYDLQGRQVAIWKAESQDVLELMLPEQVATGVFLLKLKTNSLEKTWRLIIE